jgi:hypothetical protein
VDDDPEGVNLWLDSATRKKSAGQIRQGYHYSAPGIGLCIFHRTLLLQLKP